MIRELSEIVALFAHGEAESQRPEDRVLVKTYLSLLAPILAGAVAGKDVDSELVAFERLLGHTWLTDDEPFRGALTKWHALYAARGTPADTLNALTTAYLVGMLEFVDYIGTLPAEVREHTYSYDSFGCWAVRLRFKGIAFRVAFDGREHDLRVERSADREPPYQWAVVARWTNHAGIGAIRSEVLEAVRRSAG